VHVASCLLLWLSLAVAAMENFCTSGFVDDLFVHNGSYGGVTLPQQYHCNVVGKGNKSRKKIATT